MRTDQLLIIRAALGPRIYQIEASSTFHLSLLRIDSLLDNSPYVVEEPVIFEYDHSTLGLTLPPAHFAWISTAAGRAWEFTISPHLESLDLQQARELCTRIIEAIGPSRWKARPEKASSLKEEDLAGLFAQTRRESYAHRVRAWEEDSGGKLTLSIKRIFKAENSAPRTADRFVVDVRLWGDELRDQLIEKMYDKRRSHGDADTALPMHVWKDDPD